MIFRRVGIIYLCFWSSFIRHAIWVELFLSDVAGVPSESILIVDLVNIGSTFDHFHLSQPDDVCVSVDARALLESDISKFD